jgi:RNA polymerase sigma-70 factor, ECF subfamily
LELAHESDESLMQRVVSGEREPLSLLLRRYANPVLTYIRRMTGDHDCSEELFQEVFVAVWASRRKYKYPRPFRSWLFGIATNKCHAEYRARHVGLLGLETAGTVLVGRERQPVEGAILVETAALVKQAVMALPLQQRSVIVMRIWNDFSYAQIAQALTLGESTVRSHMFHGLASLRKFLEPKMR